MARARRGPTPASLDPQAESRGVPWQHRAACRDADPALFDADSLYAARAALAYCGRCPVSAECEAARLVGRESYAVHGSRDGVWAGVLYRKGTPVRVPGVARSREARMLTTTELELRRAHARHNAMRAAGQPVDLEITAGEREYQRRRRARRGQSRRAS